MVMSVCCYQDTFHNQMEQARERLAVTIGQDNIISGRTGFMPVEISHQRSVGAFIFKLNDEGEAAFKFGIVPTEDFWEYPE